MIFKHIFKKVLLLALFTGIYFIAPVYNQYHTPIVPILCAIICIGLVGFYVYYVKKVKKSDLLSLFFILLLSGNIALPVVAQTNIEKVSGYTTEICNAVSSKNYTTEIRAKADELLDVYEKNKTNSSLSAGYTCATEYVAAIGEMQKKEDKGCTLMSVILKSVFEKDDCWPCDITALVLDAMQKMAVASYSVVSTAAISLLAIFYMGWLVISTLIFFGKFGFSKISEYFSNLLSQTLITLAIAVILHAPIINVYSTIISPFVQYGAGLAISFSEIGKEQITDNASIATSLGNVLSLGSQKCAYCEDMTDDSELSSGEFMDSGSINGILCMVCTVYRSVAPMITLGQSMVCMANANPAPTSKVPGLSSVSLFMSGNVMLLTVGYLITVLFSLLMFIIGFYLISAMMKVGLVLILMPLIITAYAFKFSRSYANNMWKLILHSIGTLISLSIATAVIMIGFNALLPDAALTVFSDMFSSNNAGTLAATFSGQASEAEGGSMTFSCLIMVAFATMSISIIDSTSKFVERVTGVWLNLSNTGSKDLVSGAMSGMTTVQAAGTGVIAGSIAGSSILKNGIGGVIGDNLSVPSVSTSTFTAPSSNTDTSQPNESTIPEAAKAQQNTKK